MSDATPTSSTSNLKIVKTELKPSGEAVQLVRPIVSTSKSTDQIVGELVNRFDYKTRDVKASEHELNTVQQAFGSNLAQELIKSYDGSNLVADSQQDLVGERYLAEQIRLIQEQQKKTSVLDKWAHLLYEGESDYKSASKLELPPLNFNDTYDKTASHYSLLIDQQQAQQQAAYLQQLQAQQQFEQKLRNSQSANLAPTASYQRLSGAQSQNSVRNYIHSQSGLNERTLSDLRLAQVQAQIEAQAMAQSHYRAQAQAQAEAIALAQAQAEAEAAIASQALVEDHREEEVHSQAQFNPHNQTLSQTQSRHSAQVHRPTSVQQPQSNLPDMSSSNLNSITLEAYNSPEFRAMLEQITKPLTVPPEQINYPPDWPSQDKINLIAEPIYIPAPQPIVIPAPSIITLQNNDVDSVYNRPELSEAAMKPTVSYYPSINNDQNQIDNFGIRQLNLEERSSSNVAQVVQY